MTDASNDLHYDWFWFVTMTTYGSWLPGDNRGSIGIFHYQGQNKVEKNKFGQPMYDPSDTLRDHAKGQMKGDELRLNLEQARVLLTQFCCTCAFRKWRLLAVAIMANHIHLVVHVHSDPEPETIKRDFKSYASRELNIQWGEPKSETWWTSSASARKLETDISVTNAIQCICDQEFPLLIWTLEHGIIVPPPMHNYR